PAPGRARRFVSVDVDRAAREHRRAQALHDALRVRAVAGRLARAAAGRHQVDDQLIEHRLDLIAGRLAADVAAQTGADDLVEQRVRDHVDVRGVREGRRGRLVPAEAPGAGEELVAQRLAAGRLAPHEGVAVLDAELVDADLVRRDERAEIRTGGKLLDELLEGRFDRSRLRI